MRDEARERWLRLGMAVALVLIALLAVRDVSAAGPCISREEAITLIAHKSDMEHGAPAWVKWRIWQIAERESGLRHCDVAGRVKVSPTWDHGLLQFNERGVWLNCSLNPYCGEPAMLDDAAAQVDVMLAYWARYGDFCPWNPDPAGRYMPGCGYR